jgi:ATP-dependent protease HslVU (ClpYQ) peptidase subunit
MTVIAYRNGIMAGDSCWSDGSEGDYGGVITNLQNKLIRLPSGALYGGAGSTDERALVQLLGNVRTVKKMPPASELEKQEYDSLKALVVLPDMSVWLIEGGPGGNGVEPVNQEFASIGCGGPIAIGAFARGATAEQAVRIACKWNVYCRPPVHTLKLKP